MYAHFGWTSVPWAGPVNLNRWASSLSRYVRELNYSLPISPHALSEHEKFYTFQVDVPGITPEGIDLTVTEKMFELRLQASDGTPADFVACALERSTITRAHRGDFREEVDVNGVEARLTDGVLSIHFPKVPKVEPQKICIEVNG